jgi:hypothetical protein
LDIRERRLLGLFQAREGASRKRTVACPFESAINYSSFSNKAFVTRMTGNLQVRFLEGWAPAMAPGYSTAIQMSV